METGKPVRVGPFSFHFTALNLLLWTLGVAFLLQVVLAGGIGGGRGGALGVGALDTLTIWASGSDGPGAVFRRGEIWRLVSSVFIHTSLLHFFVNAWGLYQLGRIAEQLYGSARLLLTFILTGVAGSLASAVWSQFREGAGVSAGASGAICGLLGLLLAHMRGRTDVAAQWFGRQLLQSAIVNLVIGFVIPYIDNAAHIGGFAAGYLLAQLFETSQFHHLGRVRRERMVRIAAWAFALVTAAALGIAGFGARDRLHFVVSAETLNGRLEEAAGELDDGTPDAKRMDALRRRIEAADAPGDLAEVKERALLVVDREGDQPEERARALRDLAQTATSRAAAGAPDLYVSVRRSP